MNDEEWTLDDHAKAILNEPSGLLLHWTLTAKLADANDTTTVVTITDERMDMVTQLGLAEATRFTAVKRYRGDFDDELEGDDD